MEKIKEVERFIKLISGRKTEDLYGDTIENLVNKTKLFENEEDAINGTSYTIMEEVFLKGNCGNFYFILSKVFPEARPFLLDGEHIVTKIGDCFYDIRGKLNLGEIMEKSLEKIDESYIIDNDFMDNYSFSSRGPVI